MRTQENCAHNFKSIKTRSQYFIGMEWNEGACYTKSPVYNTIETFYLYCEKCGKIIKQGE